MTLPLGGVRDKAHESRIDHLETVTATLNPLRYTGFSIIRKGICLGSNIFIEENIVLRDGWKGLGEILPLHILSMQINVPNLD